ncbi:4-hydroxy-tetrahydrodipicolinate synthase [Maridesulfovibrio hydrothermalis]|uniref:4-hydroxy-tetrahydrodipicolinate synthase n=1 Tax=Maridesulfovibrio hydrothermalis AM13 = DSM 14728 TaxID=1121451 RepID=L0RFB5_9BACT|nr:4-hydroxy-tetrahydrodipicolinate synthase [Maridesulfovibrio hydrothermalis]CCO24266.1 Dihydrodipicolinate synthase [Maridesulfovibrio hydrothermalis AM13 = DSM 14728]
MTFQGAFTALVTPFKNGEIDQDAYRELIEWQIEQGINGLVPCGTTGEAATMTHDEQGEVIRICVEQAKGRVPVIAGAGSNNTKEAVNLTQLAKQAGADATLQITPYYNKPTPAGLLAHFKALSAEASMPFILYNVPGRTGLNALPETVAMIANEVPDVVGIKEATANLIQCSDVIEQCPEGFVIFSGDDFTVLPLMSIGGHGVISVVSNIAPKMMSDMCAAFKAGDIAKAKELHYKMQPLNRAMFMETNPIPVKTSLGMMGKLEASFRLPIVPLMSDNEIKLKTVLKENGII